MNNWIPYPTTLQGETVTLYTLETSHFDELELLAKDKRIWEFYAFDASNSACFQKVFNSGLQARTAGTQFPFVIYHNKEQKLIGSSWFLDIQPAHRKLEIGATWLHPDYWATEVNFECKLLLLSFCFEKLHAVRVQLKTDENNWRSRTAIQKIGGQFEGILRSDMIRDNGTKRNSAYFSLLEEEWPNKKQALKDLYQQKKEAISNAKTIQL